MTAFSFVTLTLLVGFGIRAGWFLCDTLIAAVPALFDALERARYRRELAAPGTVTIVSTAITPARTVVPVEYPTGGIVRQPIGGMLVGENVDDCFARPRSHG